MILYFVATTSTIQSAAIIPRYFEFLFEIIMSPGSFSIPHGAHSVKFNSGKTNWSLRRFGGVGVRVHYFSFAMLPHTAIGIAAHLVPLKLGGNLGKTLVHCVFVDGVCDGFLAVGVRGICCVLDRVCLLRI